MTDRELIQQYLATHQATICPPAVLNPSEHIDADRLMGAVHQARAEDLPTRRGTQAAFWKEAKAASKARAMRGRNASNMKSNRKGAVI